MASVTLHNIHKSYDGETQVIKGVDLAVRDGEFMVFVGPSGCGKSTMMRMIAGLETITDGALYIDDALANNTPAPQRGVAMVFQSYALYPHMTVAQNMGFSLKMAKLSREQIRAQVARTADLLQITHLLDRTPKALSGGQRQRVAIGRAIVRKPKVFLFDEPLSNLDAGLRVQMRIELTKLHRELGTTMIYVTHDQIEAMTMGDRIAVFNAGRIEQTGTPLELYQTPANIFVAQFLGSPRMNVLPCSAQILADTVQLTNTAGSFDTNTASEIDITILSTTTNVGIRPENLSMCTRDGWPATIEAIEHLGDTLLVYAKLAGFAEALCVKVPADQMHADGLNLVIAETIHLKPKPGCTHLFDAQGCRIGSV
jgi:multiple sugar transport system ATP-binding protein